MNVGEALDLKSMLPQEVSDDQQVWETDASATASVTENGIVTALQPGTAVITVTNGDGEQVVFTVRISGEELNMPDLTIVLPYRIIQNTLASRVVNLLKEAARWNGRREDISVVMTCL